MTGPPAPPVDRLTAITFGPGYGESTVIRIPPDHWLVVDSLQEPTTGRNPALEFLRRQEVTASALILTHRHQDHAAGFDRLIDAQADGLVGCVEDGPTPSDDALVDPDAEVVLGAARAQHAEAAIRARWASRPESRWALTWGHRIEIGEATVEVLSPHTGAVARARSGADFDVNTLSAAVAINWGRVRIVLAADLPATEWRKVTRDRPGTRPGDHVGLKVPHHGSSKAQHKSLSEPADGRIRRWWLSPWNRGDKLPRLEDGEGVDVLLRRVERVALTSLPFELGTPITDQCVTRGMLDAAIHRSRFGADDMLLEYEQTAPGPEEAWVSVSFDATGCDPDVNMGGAAWEIRR